MDSVGNWSAHQLAEFLAAVTSYGDVRSATVAAVERAAESLEAEVGALVRDGRVESVVGFPSGRVPEEDILAVALGWSDGLDVPGAGRCRALVVPLDERPPAQIILARSGGDGFTTDEANLARGMAKVVSLSLRLLRALDAERSAREVSERRAQENAGLAASLGQRQSLLEKLLNIQRAISHRVPLQDVLDAITRSAQELLGEDESALRLIDPDDAAYMITVASTGVRDDVRVSTHRTPVGLGAGGRAISEGSLVVIEAYAQASGVIPLFASGGVQAAMAAPVHENGVLVGSLTVGSHLAGRTYTQAERETLLSFAEHASIALTDAKTVERMHHAFHDSLTGLPNRALFLNRLEQALARANRARSRIALLFADLDRFKEVNDSLGQAAGDHLLVMVSDRIRGTLRASDTAARLGGDEFAVLVEENAELNEVVPVATRILEALKEPFPLLGRDVRISASIGIALNTVGREEAGEVLRNADVAMYRAKTQGRGRCAVFEPAMHAALMENLELEADLRRSEEAESPLGPAQARADPR